jgi:hypothetical protein
MGIKKEIVIFVGTARMPLYVTYISGRFLLLFFFPLYILLSLKNNYMLIAK